VAGVFPYLESGELKDRSGGVLVAELPLTKYDGGQFASPSGENYDATAYCPSRVAGEHLIGQSNRRLTIAGVVYTVVSCIEQQFVGQLELGLKRNQAV
jgi:hypothetical protein